MKLPNWRSVLTPAAILLAASLACGTAVAQMGSDAEEAQNSANPDLWPSMGQNLGLDRHSALTQINTSNVSNLEMAWSQSLGDLRGQEGQPIVVQVDGKPMMYFVSGWPNIVQALDLSDPDHPVEVWNYVKKTDRDLSAVPRACCDTVNRGLNYADGKVLFNTLDGYLIALDGKTGAVVWEVKHAYPDHGETVTNAPLIADNKVIVGFGGDEFAARGRIEAYDLATGKLAWRYWDNGTDQEIGLTPKSNKWNPQYGTYGHKTGMTYPGDEWKRGGGSPWAWYSYDPELKLVYYGSGNPGLWSPAYRCGAKPPTQKACNDGKWDNKWSMTMFARNVETGKVVWAMQKTPFDQWDYDGVNEPILVDMTIDGKMRRTVVEFDRNGFSYVWDRATGTLLEAHKFVDVNWAEKVDLKTGRPVKVYEHSPLLVNQMAQACPSAMGGKDQQPASVDPSNPQIFYVPTNNWCMQDTPQTRTSLQQGIVYVFANVYMYDDKPGIAGRLKAFNVVTGQTVWDIPDKYPNWGGTLNTGGGVVFYGSLGGDFRAVDEKTGKILWSRKLGSGIIGNPISYKVDGHQYVSVFAGIGGWIGLPVTAGLDLNDKYGAIGATAMAKAGKLNLIPQGGELYTFRLPDRVASGM
ncbi:MAG: PQQ-dependent dehydrogenase, methanol/ethanol family [Steroidobacteraceae bacterium]